jgi:DNA helicase-2/ATP-dependent DNA helicase PcrA
VYTHAERRAGYARKLSPYLESLDVSEPDAVAPPAALRRGRPTGDAILGRQTEWRAATARRARVVPAQILSDRDLSKLAASLPRTAEEIDAATSIGLLTARRLAPQVLPLITTPSADVTT